MFPDRSLIGLLLQTIQTASTSRVMERTTNLPDAESCSTQSRPTSTKRVAYCKSRAHRHAKERRFEHLVTEKGISLTIARIKTNNDHEKNSIVSICLDSIAGMLIKYCMTGLAEGERRPKLFSPVYSDILFNVGGTYLLTTAFQMPELRRRYSASASDIPFTSSSYGREKAVILGPVVLLTGKLASIGMSNRPVY